MFVVTRLLSNLVFLAPLPAKLGFAVDFLCAWFSACAGCGETVPAEC